MDTNNTNTSHIPPNGIGALTFTPFFAPNIIFTVIFALLLLTQLILTVRFWRFYGYAIGMVGGLLLEMVGYVAKVQLSRNRFNKNAYIMYIIGLTLGPTFLSSSLYLGIRVLQQHYHSARIGRISPTWFATLFILGDFLCLCFIGVGGSLAAIYAEQPIGVDLMIAGLATQVLFTTIFCTLLWIVYRKIHGGVVRDKGLTFIYIAAVAAACLFVRSCWRCAELSGGFNGPLSSKEGVFIGLDSIPIIVMSTLVTILHPKFWFDGAKRGPVRHKDEFALADEY